MATRNIVPRADNEGSVGTAAKRWSDLRAVLSTITTGVITTLTSTTATITTAICTAFSASAATNVTFVAGTTSVAPINMTAGTNLTGATAGALEYDGNVFYQTPVASARAVNIGTQYAIVEAGDFALLTTSGVQSAFPTTKDVWTLAASTTYYFEGAYYITHTTTTCTAAMAFAAGGGASVTSINYLVESSNQVVNTTATTSNFTWVGQIGSTVVSLTSTAGWVIRFRGLMRTNAAGTWTPQINWSANTTAPVMKADSYIMFTPIGTNTNNTVGNVA